MSAAGTGAADDPAAEAVVPLFRVVRGTPTDVELAALSVVLAARTRPGGEEAAPPPPGPSAWALSARTAHGLGRPGPRAWRMSGR